MKIKQNKIQISQEAWSRILNKEKIKMRREEKKQIKTKFFKI